MAFVLRSMYWLFGVTKTFNIQGGGGGGSGKHHGVVHDRVAEPSSDTTSPSRVTHLEFFVLHRYVDVTGLA